MAHLKTRVATCYRRLSAEEWRELYDGYEVMKWDPLITALRRHCWRLHNIRDLLY